MLVSFKCTGNVFVHIQTLHSPACLIIFHRVIVVRCVLLSNRSSQLADRISRRNTTISVGSCVRFLAFVSGHFLAALAKKNHVAGNFVSSDYRRATYDFCYCRSSLQGSHMTINYWLIPAEVFHYGSVIGHVAKCGF